VNIVWFEKAPKGRGNAAGDKALKITFTDKPKGVRCNVALTRRLSHMGAHYVRMGVQDGLFVIIPVGQHETGFKLITNKSSAQVCAASIGEWAAVLGLIKKRVHGKWEDARGAFTFDCQQALDGNMSDEGRKNPALLKLMSV
jgi:hypothetical protein